MKTKQILLAVAGVLVSAQAFAQSTPVTKAQIENPASVAGGPTILQQTWITGASASVQAAFDSFAQGCNPGTVAVFTDGVNGNRPGSYTSSANAGTNNTAYACTRGTGTGERITVMYQSIGGGSLFAVSPHTLGLNTTNGLVNRLRNLAISANACTGTATSFNYTFPGNATVFSVPVSRGCPATAETVATSTATVLGGTTGTTANSTIDPVTLQLPAGGFLDVQPSEFPSTLIGNFASKGVTAQTQTGQVFAVVVNTTLYRDLQVDQGIYASVAAANTADPNFDPANAPSISKAIYTSAISASGFHSDGSDITPSGAGKKYTVFRRTDTSGTQMSSNMFFLNNQCANGVGGNLTAQGTVSGATYAVSPQGSTGGVKSGITSTPAGQYAIGVVSMENDWRIDNSSNNGWRIVKLDGVHPETGSAQTNPEYPAGTTFYTARLTSVNAQYPFQIESYQFRANKTTSAADPLGFELLNEAGGGAAGSLLARLAKPSVCTDVARGVTILPTGSSTCNDQFSATPDNVVSKTTRGGNNCRPSQF